MKKVLKRFSCFFVVIVLLSTACSLFDKKVPPEKKESTYYICTMHPKIRQSKPGVCPICGMNLVGKKETSISPVYFQQIGVQTDVVKVRLLVKTMNLYGKVAHDPELWVAQNEYIQSLNLGDSRLIQSSELKLKFLGLSNTWINLLKKNRTADLGLHLPEEGKQGFFEAFVFQGDIEGVGEGQEVSILDEKGKTIQSGIVWAVGTNVNRQSGALRILIQSQGMTDLKSNTFVQFQIHIPSGEVLSIPKEAILFYGDHNMVYTVEEGETTEYLAKKVELGEEASGYYEIKGGLVLGEHIVTNGSFLIDSESQVKMHEHQH